MDLDAALRYLGMGVAGLLVIVSAMVVLGLPVRWMLRPITASPPWQDAATPAG